LNPGRRGGKPATNRLSYGAAYQCNKCNIVQFLGALMDTAAGAEGSVISFLAACSVLAVMLCNFDHLFLGQQVRDWASGLENRVTDIWPLSNISSLSSLQNLSFLQDAGLLTG
jgi:hypothetical protein